MSVTAIRLCLVAESVHNLTLFAPWRASEPLTVQMPMTAVGTPWGTPETSWLRAVRADRSGLLALMYETPVNWMHMSSPMPKKELERLHLRKLAMDCRAATGQELFDEVTSEGETPDFRILTEGREVGWEMTQLAIEQRRQAQHLFFEVTDRVALLPRRKIKHLFGYQIYMWFGDAKNMEGLPFKKSMADAYEELVDALVAYKPDPSSFEYHGDVPPAEAPPYPIHDIEGVQFFAVPLAGSVPASPFHALTGTNFGLAFQTDHYEAEEWEKLREVVRRKDKASNDILVISAGAPDRMGRCFTTEEVLANFLIDHPVELRAEHLSAVILHFWSTGRAVDLLGDAPRELWRGSFAGLVPAHQPIASAERSFGAESSL